MNGVAIGIDVGTSGVRAALVDAAGDPVAWGAAPLPGEHRRNPAAWWAAVEQALATLQAAGDLSAVRAVAVDGTSGTVLPADQLFGNSRAHSILVNLEPGEDMDEGAFTERHYGPATKHLPALTALLRRRMG